MRLDHVFVIMMENHAYGQIANNPQAPFINSLIAKSNLATNYFAIAHPRSTNYLEVVGGSNFNKLSDQYPDWHNTSCIPNIAPGQTTNTDNPNSGLFCPISGKDGKDAAIPALDTTTNETSSPAAHQHQRQTLDSRRHEDRRHIHRGSTGGGRQVVEVVPGGTAASLALTAST